MIGSLTKLFRKKEKQEEGAMSPSNWVDFKEIKERVNIFDVLSHYGLLETLKRKGDSLSGPCPIHKGSNKSGFHASISKNNFNCFGDCHGGGNVIDFVCAMEGLDKSNPKEFREAALLLKEWFLGEEEERDKKEAAQKARALVEAVKETPAPVEKLDKKKEGIDADHGEVSDQVKGESANPPLKFALKNLDPEHPYLTDRGLEKLTIKFFGIGFCSKGMMAGRVAIPIHNSQGELVAYVGRWPGQPPEGEGKYRLPAGFRKSLEVFNLHRAREFARSEGLILVEGLFDCMKVWQAGFQNVVSLLGSSMSEEQERLILEAVGSGGRVALMFDEDAAGWACRDEVRERLSSKVFVKVIPLGDEGLQPDMLNEEGIKRVLGIKKEVEDVPAKN